MAGVTNMQLVPFSMRGMGKVSAGLTDWRL